jgi:hypothetical protein
MFVVVYSWIAQVMGFKLDETYVVLGCASFFRLKIER